MKKHLILVLLLLVVTACAHRPPTTGDALQKAYLAAVKDAEVACPAEISRDLAAITPWNTKLIRDTETAVRVVTWTDWDGYDAQVGQQLTLGRDVWVTLVPNVQAFCRSCGLTGEPLGLRLRQRLGLPPDDIKSRFVEFWVSPEALFRPSPDPEVTDHEAELSTPGSSQFVGVSDAHKAWMKALKKSSYGEGGYPWTRLGYTYDWGGETEIGESEFVITKGAKVKVYSVTPTEAYCK